MQLYLIIYKKKKKPTQSGFHVMWLMMETQAQIF